MGAPWEKYQAATNPLETALEMEGVTGQQADIARSIYQQESGSGKNTKTSNAGARGGMQVIPATFNRMADKGWAIDDPVHNARAGVRYINALYTKADGDPALTAAGYYGGEGAINKAKRGVAVSDPRNPKAPNTLQYGAQVAARLPQQPAGAPWEKYAQTEQAQPAAPVEQQAYSNNPFNSDFYNDMSLSNVPKNAANAVGGIVSGLADIGQTISYPVNAIADMVQGQPIGTQQTDMRAKYDNLFSENLNTNSGGYQGGKIAGNIGGTWGVGGVLAKGAEALKAYKLANALKSGGFMLGGAPAKTAGQALGNATTRLAGGAGVGAASAGLINPDDVLLGAGIGAAIPASVVGAGKLAMAAGRGIKSAVAPLTIKGNERIVGDTLLNMFGGNTAKLRGYLDELDNAQGNTAGFNPTVGQATSNADVATKERVFSMSNPQLFEETTLAQKQALANAARGMGGDDIDRLRLVEGRSNAVDDLYQEAESSNLVADDAFNELMQRPAIKGAFSAAATNTANKGEKLVKGKTDVIETQSAGERLNDIPEEAYYKEYAGKKLSGGEGKTLLAEIRRMGGIDLTEIRDILGEKTGKAAKAQVGLFNRKGAGIDDLASMLSDKGYIPPDAMDFDGGVRYLKDAIRDNVDGNKSYALHDQPFYAKATGEMQDSLAGVDNPNYFSEIKDGNNVYSGKVINEARKSLNAQKNFKPSSSAEAATIEGVRAASDAFNEYINKAIPSMQKANTTFASLSKPINQMDLGNEIANKFIPARYSDSPIPSQLNYNEASKILFRNGDALAKKITGFKGATLKNTLNPKQLKDLENIVKDSQYVANGQMKGNKGGSATFQNLAFNRGLEKNDGITKAMTDIAPRGIILGTLTAIRDLAYTAAEKKLTNSLADMLQNPKQAAALIRKSSIAADKKTAMLKFLESPQLSKISQAATVVSVQ